VVLKFLALTKASIAAFGFGQNDWAVLELQTRMQLWATTHSCAGALG
jgi:hypothetical protein